MNKIARLLAEASKSLLKHPDSETARAHLEMVLQAYEVLRAARAARARDRVSKLRKKRRVQSILQSISKPLPYDQKRKNSP